MTLFTENWPFSRDFLPDTAYMVGGAVRDALLGRKAEYLDLDFIIPYNAVGVATAMARHYHAGFVLLDAERQIARVVFPSATVDFAQQEGDSLEADLSRRDFTINAIAYHPHTQTIIDPLNGCADLSLGILRMVSTTNLLDDPLRLLRAYRQAAQLNFTIEPTTLTTIQSLSSQISQVAAERVRGEISYLLANSQATPWLMAAITDGLLAGFLPHATAHTCPKIGTLETAVALVSHNFPQLTIELNQCIRNSLKTTWLGIAKLACLVDSHPSIAERELQQASYSRAENHAVTTALKLFPQLKSADTLRKQYFLFQSAGIVFAATLILALVDNILVTGMSGQESLNFYRPLIHRYLNPNDLVAHPTPLVSGNDLILALNLRPSQLIGELLTEIAIAQAEGKVTSREDAIKCARLYLKGENPSCQINLMDYPAIP